MPDRSRLLATTRPLAGRDPAAPLPALRSRLLSASDINAEIAGQLVLQGAATATNAITAAMAGALGLVAAETASGAIAASASGTIQLVGAAEGTNASTAAVAGQLALVGAADAAEAISDSTAGTMILAGASDATVAIVASVAGDLPLVGEATGGMPALTAEIAGTLELVGEATGTMGDVPSSPPAEEHGGFGGGSGAPYEWTRERRRPITAEIRGAFPLEGHATGSMGPQPAPEVPLPFAVTAWSPDGDDSMLTDDDALLIALLVTA